jgi:acetyl esterase/lipase
MKYLRSLCTGLTLAIVVSGCSGGGGLTTASLLGTPAKPELDEPTERALHSASISARASKCGYNFDPRRLRESFLAAEAANGATPEQMAKLGQSYDFTRETVSKQITQPEEYCSEGKTREVSAALTRQLAGDFKAPKKPPLPKSAGWWDTTASQKPFDKEEVFNPRSSR